MEKAVIGIIGCGNIARDQHLRNAFSNPRIRVKWCADLYARIKKTYGTRNRTY